MALMFCFKHHYYIIKYILLFYTIVIYIKLAFSVFKYKQNNKKYLLTATSHQEKAIAMSFSWKRSEKINKSY